MLRNIESLKDKLLYPTIPVGFLSDVLQAARFRGEEVEALLQANGLSLAGLDEAGVRVSVDKYSDVLRQVGWQTDDAFFGFLSKPVPIKAFSVFAYSLVGCRTLQEVVQQANDFYGLFTDEFQWAYAEDGEEVLLGITVKPALPIDYRFIIQSLLLMTIRLFGWMLGEEVKANSVNFSFGKNSTDENLTYLFGQDINYGCDTNVIHLDSRYASSKFSCTRDQIAEMLKGSRHLFLISRQKNPVSQEVRRLLLSNKYEEWLEVEDIAELLKLTPNQLWRKLKKEGSSFLEIRDQIKRDWALVLLEDPANTVEEVAEQLRYSDVSAFRKAFKKWTGLQPVQYRSLLE